MMRVLLATDNYPPHIGGAQIQSRLIARELRDRGHEVAVAAVWQDGMAAVEDDDGIPVYRLRQLRTLPLIARKRRQHYQPPFPDPVTVVGLRRLIARFQPDIVHAYGWFSYACAAALIGKDIPLLLTARDYAYSCPKRTLMYNGEICTGPAPAKCLGCAARHYGRLKGWTTTAGVLGSAPLLRRKVHGLHSISSYVQTIMRRDFLDDRDSGRPVSVIHDMIASAPEEESGNGAEPIAAYLERLPTEPFLLFVGALRRVKGVEQLLAAYELLVDPPPLVLIGTLEPDTPQMDIPAGVHVLTDFPHAAVMAAWERCLFGVLPSLLPEAFGLTAIEAMSMGRPVIATTAGALPEIIIHGKSGLVVSPGDVGALRRALATLLRDDRLREHLGESAYRRSGEFRASAVIPRFERAYQRAIILAHRRVESGISAKSQS